MTDPTTRACREAGYPEAELFDYEHLPPWLQDVSRPFGEIARNIRENAPICAETGVGLRKLLEAKDCFVRSEVLMRNHVERQGQEPGLGVGRERDFAPET